MKKQFQSLTEKGRWLLATLTLIFTLGIGQMWATDPTYDNPARVTYAEKTFLDVAGTAANVTGTDNYLCYGTLYMFQTVTGDKFFARTSGTGGTSSSSYTYATPAAGFLAASSTSATNTYGSINANSGRPWAVYFTGATEVKVLKKDNNTSSNKWVILNLYSVASNGTETLVETKVEPEPATSIKVLNCTTALSTSTYYKLEITSGNTSNCAIYQVSFKQAPSCDDANASIIADQSIYVNDELDLEFTSDNVSTVSYSIKKGGSTTSDASVADGVFKATVAGTYVVTATQAKDASNHCAVEESVTITVNAKTPVASVSISGDATAFIGMAKTLTASADQAVSEYKWEVDGVDQGVNAATFDFSAAAAGTYSVVCKARNSFNDPGEYISSSAHSITVTKLCGTLITYTVETGGSNIDKDFTVPAGGETNVIGGSGHQKTEKTGKIGSGCYISLTLASGSFKAGDVVTVVSSTDYTKLHLFSDAGITSIAEKDNPSHNESVEIESDATTIYLYRNGTDGSAMNPTVTSISVARSCAISDDCSIKSLTINGEAITPAEKVYSYEVAAASALTEVAVAYTIHPLATGSPASGFNVTVPAAGDPANTQTITVTAEDGTHSDTYTVSVTKAAAASDVVTLDALGVTGYTLDPAFDAGTLAYTITKAYGAEDPGTDKVTYTKTETEQTVGVAYDGTNHKLTVTVTAEDNTTTQDYVITINEAEAPKSLSRVLFNNGFDAFIDNTNHTVKAYYLAGAAVPTATTITAGAGTAGELAEGKITVTGADASTVDYIVTLAEVTPNTTTVAEDAAAGEFAGDEAWVKNGLLVYGNAAGYSAGDKWYVNRRLTKGGDAADDQRVIAGWVRSYFFVGNASKFIMTVGGNRPLKYAIDGGEYTEVNVETLEIALSKGNHMIEIVSNQSSGDCRLSAPKLVELPPTFSVTYVPNGGSGAEYILDSDASEVAAGTIFTAPASSIFAGWNTQADGNGVAYAAGDAVTDDLILFAQWRSYFTITYMDGETELDTEDVFEGDAPVGIADPAKIGYDFAGWTLSGSDEVINVTELSASTTVYAKWIAFDGCVLLYPATSGSTIAVGDEISMQSGSKGATMVAVSKDESCTLAYESYGLSFASSGNTSRVKVTLANDIAVGTKITATIVANGNSGSNRALDLYNSAVAKKASLGWTSSDEYAKYDVGTFSYTVTSEDGMAGTNEFYLYRNNSVYLQCLKVESCGAAIVYHNLTSAVDPADKGTVTLGASSVREGYTTTATYSDIDPLYEFVSWSVSGAGASVENATANPATITVGTEDAVVTLNLQLIPVKFTVNYYDNETLMGSELVAVNENPTASEINTNKRHFTFQGWSETNGGSVVALNTITSDVAATIDLYAVYAPVACPTEGTVFSMEFDNTKTPTSTVKVAKDGGSIDLADYATISGGNAVIENTETSDKDAISTDGKFLLKAYKEVMKIELECAIATGDVIRIPDNNAKYVLSAKADKTGTYQSQTSSQHEFEATADWNGVDDLYILYDGSSLNFTKVYVLRPYTISFDLQGHGDAIDAQKLVAGKKVEEPAAPTADGWDFGGWYKEAACTNAWDFDNDVVEGSISIYAKWSEHVTNDATLKSLKYGTTDITLLDGIYSYDVELAASVAAVPALSAVTNAELATKLITDAEAFVAGQATSTVLVTAEDGATQLTYTVNFTKAAAIELVDVTGNMTWDFSKANDGSAAGSNLCNDEVLANVAGIVNNSDFKSDNIKATANKFASGKLQASMIKFHTTVPGSVIVKCANTGSSKPMRYLYVNGVQTELGSTNGTVQTYAEYVPAGDVVLTVMPTTETGTVMFNFTSVEFKLDNDLEPARTDDWLAPGEMGTICIPQGAVAVGADIYDLVGSDPETGKIVFETVKHMKPGKPYMFISKGDRIDLILTDETAASEPDNSGAMKGTFTEITLTADQLENVYYFAQHALWSCVDLTATGLLVPANRAYVKLNEIEPIQAEAPAPGRRRMSLGVIGAPQVTTGMENLNAGDQPVKVIMNGQLYILRGEKMYDATGRLVK